MWRRSAERPAGSVYALVRGISGSSSNRSGSSSNEAMLRACVSGGGAHGVMMPVRSPGVFDGCVACESELQWSVSMTPSSPLCVSLILRHRQAGLFPTPGRVQPAGVPVLRPMNFNCLAQTPPTPLCCCCARTHNRLLDRSLPEARWWSSTPLTRCCPVSPVKLSPTPSMPLLVMPSWCTTCCVCLVVMMAAF